MQIPSGLYFGQFSLLGWWHQSKSITRPTNLCTFLVQPNKTKNQNRGKLPVRECFHRKRVWGSFRSEWFVFVLCYAKSILSTTLQVNASYPEDKFCSLLAENRQEITCTKKITIFIFVAEIKVCRRVSTFSLYLFCYSFVIGVSITLCFVETISCWHKLIIKQVVWVVNVSSLTSEQFPLFFIYQ